MNPVHPLFSNDNKNEWFEFSTIEEGSRDEELIALIRRDQARIIEAAARVLRELTQLTIPDDPSRNVSGHLVSFWGTSDRGFYSYLEFRFPSHPADNDCWWVMVACSQPFHKAFSTPRYSVWRFGWECDL